jgi:hypothetical protein
MSENEEKKNAPRCSDLPAPPAQAAKMNTCGSKKPKLDQCNDVLLAEVERLKKELADAYVSEELLAREIQATKTKLAEAQSAAVQMNSSFNLGVSIAAARLFRERFDPVVEHLAELLDTEMQHRKDLETKLKEMEEQQADLGDSELFLEELNELNAEDISRMLKDKTLAKELMGLGIGKYTPSDDSEYTMN